MASFTGIGEDTTVLSSRSTESTLSNIPERYNLPGDSGDGKKQRRLVQFSFFCPDRLQPDHDTLSEALVHLDVLDEQDPPQVFAIGWLCSREEDALASRIERLAVEGQLAEHYGTSSLPQALESALSSLNERQSSTGQVPSRMPVLKGTPIGPIRSWCIQFGMEPRIYVETDDAWYHVVYYDASPEYAPYFESARSKFEVAVRADLLCAKTPGARIRPAVDLTYGYVTFSLTLPFAGMRSYDEEQIHEVGSFLLEQATELDSYLPESHFLSVVARRQALGGAPSRSLSGQVLSEERRRRMMRQLLHILADICRRHDARELRELSNAHKYPGYDRVVPVPLDLNLIMHRLQTGEFYAPDSPSDVVRDIRQVFMNCRLYMQCLDRESQKVLIRATRIEHLFDEQLIRIETAIQQDTISDSSLLPAIPGMLGTQSMGSAQADYNRATTDGIAPDDTSVEVRGTGLEAGANADISMDVDSALFGNRSDEVTRIDGQDAGALPKKRVGKRRKQSGTVYLRGSGSAETGGSEPTQSIVVPKSHKLSGDGRLPSSKLTCAYPICSNEPRRGSKYCSDECGCAVAILRLAVHYETLPPSARRALLAAEVVARRLAPAGKESQRAAQALLMEQEAREQEARTLNLERQATHTDSGSLPSLEPLPPPPPNASASVLGLYASLQGLETEMKELEHRLKRTDALIADVMVHVAAAPDDRCGFGGYCQWSASRGQRPNGAAGAKHSESLESSAESVLTRPCPIHGNWRANKPLEYHRERQIILSRMHDLVSTSRRLAERIRMERNE